MEPLHSEAQSNDTPNLDLLASLLETWAPEAAEALPAVVVPSEPVPAEPVPLETVPLETVSAEALPEQTAPAWTMDAPGDGLLVELLLTATPGEPGDTLVPAANPAPTASPVPDDGLLESLLLSPAAPPQEAPLPAPVAPARSPEDIRAELRSGLFEMIFNIEQRILAAKRPNQYAPQNLTRWILCEIDGDRYAVPIEQVLETGHLPPATPVPGLSPALRGLINHRGEVLPLADFRYLIGGVPKAASSNERMIVVRTQNSHGPCALAVDRVPGLLAISPHDIETQPGQYVTGFCKREGEIVRLLDLERLFNHLAASLAGAASVS
jgi:purine-binding chemotaxis protein CheW